MTAVKGIEYELAKTLDEFSKEKLEDVQKAVEMAAKQAKRDIVQASPGDGEYRSGWSVRTKKSSHGVEAIVFNKTKPGLTHLLEKSHVIRNQFGIYGRTSPGHGQVVHIGPAAEKAVEYLLQLLENG